MEENINYEALREDLLNYFGSAKISVYSPATMEVIEIENASESQLLVIAEVNGFNKKDYIIK